MAAEPKEVDLLGLAGDIVSAYITKNPVPAAELPKLIESVHGAVKRIALGSVEEPHLDLVPAVPIKKSITPDYIICLEDGKRFKSLKRHLRTRYEMTADEYRAKWNLPSDYPMVAPNYAARRSELAKQIGLGSKRAAVVEPPPAPKRRSRRKSTEEQTPIAETMFFEAAAAE